MCACLTTLAHLPDIHHAGSKTSASVAGSLAASPSHLRSKFEWERGIVDKGGQVHSECIHPYVHSFNMSKCVYMQRNSSEIKTTTTAEAGGVPAVGG
jgi:hypothetical protein